MFRRDNGEGVSVTQVEEEVHLRLVGEEELVGKSLLQWRKEEVSECKCIKKEREVNVKWVKEREKERGQWVSG